MVPTDQRRIHRPMPRTAAKDPARTRAKHAAAIEAVNDNIRKLQDQLTQVEDLRQEGFPYRDAMRARAELQVRECIKYIFGERSPEFQQWKTYHLRTSSPSEVAETISLLQTLIAQLERKKLELQGLAPPASGHASTIRSAPAALPPVSTTATAGPVASATPARMTTLSPAAPAAIPVTATLMADHTGRVDDHSVPLSRQANTPVHSDDLSHDLPRPLPEQGDARHGLSPVDQAPAPQTAPSPPPPGTSQGPGVPSMPEPREQVRDSANQGDAPAAAPGPLSDPPTRLPDPIATARHPTQEHVPDRLPDHVQPEPPFPSAISVQPTEIRAEVSPPPATTAGAVGQISGPSDRSEGEPEDPLDLVRKVCTRFHAVVRQLRLRGDDRTTLDVQDEQDVHDLLYTLLRYEFDEVAQTEWPASRPATAPRAVSLLPRHRLAVLAKMTRSGLGPREIAEQLTAEAASFPAAGHQTLFCFIYDPEGRIGNPRGLEAELTRVSDAQIVEVFIAPK